MTAKLPDEKTIFDVACRIEDASARENYVSQVCAENEVLRNRVQKLLRMHEEEPDFLDDSPVCAIATMDVPGPPLIGAQIGPYKLREQIGEGGMGVVYVAEQTEPVKRKVALKLIKPGMDSRQVVARFEAERQALAMMDHPNIARVLDAGTTGEERNVELGMRNEETPHSPLATPHFAGRPYFVMELVQGLPITEYCDQHGLSTRERLQLFLQVCRAVQHAHQKGIIHRDLKPSNVLVPEIDGTAVPKVIDFGVAKAVNQGLTEQTLYTQFSQMVGTPLYMSPEQAGLGVIDVDTRSDIYSLSVLLYELLTGNTPFDSETLKKAGFDEMRRIIREDEPPRPSTMVSTFDAQALSTVAQHRGSDPRKLSASLAGELDWIVMKAMDKDRWRRYETASALSRDIERYLRDEPVQACPPSTIYRLRKYARRNTTLLAAGVAITAALIVGLGLSAWMYVRAATERARAQATSDFLDELFAHSEDDGEVEEVIRGIVHVIDVKDEHAAEFEGSPASEAELATSYAWLANFLATRNRSDEAKAVVGKAGDHLGHAATGGLTPAAHLKALWYLAIAKLRLEDEAGYHETCRALLHVPTNNDDDRQLVLTIWCLGPHPREDLSVPLKQAEELAAKLTSNEYVGSYSAPWIDVGVIGGLLYRAGQYELAADRLEDSLAAYPDDALRGFRTNLCRQLLLAMTKWQLGERDDAQRILAETQPAVKEWLQMPSNTWMRRAEIELLRREAEALIEPIETDKAEENTSRSNDR